MAKKEDILGTWKLRDALEEIDGRVQTNPNVGEGATGYLHYLPENRVSVLISLAGRKRMTGNHRREATMEELAQSALTIDAYVGTFELLPDNHIAHHIEAFSYENNVGTTFLRRIEIEGDLLRLFPAELQGNDRRWLVWQKVPMPA